MAVVMRMSWPGVTKEQYDEARDKVGWEREPAEGGNLHVAWWEGDTLNVIDVWDSPEHFQRFGEERLMPVVAGEMGIEGQPDVSFHPVHRVWSPHATLPV